MYLFWIFKQLVCNKIPFRMQHLFLIKQFTVKRFHLSCTCYKHTYTQMPATWMTDKSVCLNNMTLSTDLLKIIALGNPHFPLYK